MRRYPLSFIVLTTLGVLCAIPGLLSLIGLRLGTQYGAVILLNLSCGEPHKIS